jgi:uncharacterized protein YecE (DUF72 family)
VFQGEIVPDYLVGAGGWGYFEVPGKSSLKAYSEVFGFVEVNCTFYEYPDVEVVERWRRTVPDKFVFALRCHQDLTHRIGLRPVDEAYSVFGRMIAYCGVLDSPFLVLETPASYQMTDDAVADARDFFSSVIFGDVRLVWEIRAPLTDGALGLMRDFNIVHCVDLSRERPAFVSDVVYSRLFGKGWHNLYQFTDEELVDIDKSAQGSGAKVVALSYHGARMYSDAARFAQYKRAGSFIPATSFVGANSVREVLAEDANFPLSKAELIADQGWKVVDVSANKRVHLSELLAKIPQRTYSSVDEVADALEGAA